ncbi:4-hydroxythreonine-4-phosphate dehydrogenase PdxA [Rhizobium sp. BK376]|uniref:4-hydroxythreonine-4-phosphate dehydrogenase PdxA n=1 Tax=Rhizobium sp. BK376 TaxID=2512149 RepID=UPI0010468BE3|nr:4-hydroxythreonine-4-phosphate dehydrogenase PdxA [Rhizobium sp. BK376]TCR69228.1 4-hydroxythreonine-4-phosphate dehydrogenase [Rhizobium sp. BK376]
MSQPRIAITSGDPAGIGPEIMARAAEVLWPRISAGELSLALVGSAAAHSRSVAALGLEDRARLLTGSVAHDRHAGLTFVDVDPTRAAVPVGHSTAAGGKIAYDAIAGAVKLALSGAADAICTGPISKEALNLAGYHYSGHTELLADLTEARDSVMLLAHGNMRVSHITTHVALQDVPKRVTPQRISRVVALTDGALRTLGLERRKIAIAALNPHAGEGGLFGRQDIDVVEPTIRALRDEGFDVEGPVPGDTVFVKLRARQFDAVVAMYHDQGHIPVKLLGFSVDEKSGRWEALSGVNVTLGLPIIRTSVDHGTAFDIAGKGIASETSLIEAVELAVAMSRA